MGSIDEDGLLSEDVTKLIRDFRSRCAEWSSLATDMNRFAVGVLKRVSLDRLPPIGKLFTALFFGRVVANSQAAMLLGERGMIPQAEGMCRLSLDSLFTLGALVRHPDTMEALSQDDAFYRKRDAETLRRTVTGGGLQLSPEDIRDLVTLEAEVATNPDKQLRVASLASWAGLDSLYRSAYISLSKPAHSAMRDVERALVLDASGLPEAMHWGPDARGLDFVLFAAVTCLRHACKFAAAGLALELGPEFVELERRHDQLSATKQPTAKPPAGR